MTKSGSEQTVTDPFPESSCPICLMELGKVGILVTECGHTFHINCIKLITKNECPKCRCVLNPDEQKQEVMSDIEKFRRSGDWSKLSLNYLIFIFKGNTNINIVESMDRKVNVITVNGRKFYKYCIFEMLQSCLDCMSEFEDVTDLMDCVLKYADNLYWNRLYIENYKHLVLNFPDIDQILGKRMQIRCYTSILDSGYFSGQLNDNKTYERCKNAVAYSKEKSSILEMHKPSSCKIL